MYFFFFSEQDSITPHYSPNITFYTGMISMITRLQVRIFCLSSWNLKVGCPLIITLTFFEFCVFFSPSCSVAPISISMKLLRQRYSQSRESSGIVAKISYVTLMQSCCKRLDSDTVKGYVTVQAWKVITIDLYIYIYKVRIFFL